MLPARVVTVFMFLLFSLGNLMPGKHLLLETESGDSDNGEAAEPQGEGEVVKWTYWKSPDHSYLIHWNNLQVRVLRWRIEWWDGMEYAWFLPECASRIERRWTHASSYFEQSIKQTFKTWKLTCDFRERDFRVLIVQNTSVLFGRKGSLTLFLVSFLQIILLIAVAVTYYYLVKINS